uniref:Serine/Arginine-related protein 53 n=1 Tax=Catharus ustulatus TaxID=91951 RepID=A0A8C3Y7L7_CATUS
MLEFEICFSCLSLPAFNQGALFTHRAVSKPSVNSDSLSPAGFGVFDLSQKSSGICSQGAFSTEAAGLANTSLDAENSFFSLPNPPQISLEVAFMDFAVVQLLSAWDYGMVWVGRALNPIQGQGRDTSHCPRVSQPGLGHSRDPGQPQMLWEFHPTRNSQFPKSHPSLPSPSLCPVPCPQSLPSSPGAPAGSDACPSCAEQSSLLEQVKRVKEIEAIESDAFVPQSFRSSKEVKKQEPGNVGAGNPEAAAEKEPPAANIPTAIKYQDDNSLAHPNLFLEKAEAEERWFQRLVALRQERLMGSPVA